MTYNQTVDGEGRIVSVQNAGTGDTWTFTYDDDGNRIRQANPDGTAALFVAGRLYKVALDAGGQQTGVKRYYTIAGQQIALRNADGTYYLLTDHLGSVVPVLDGTGAQVYEQRYRPFGQPRLSTAGSPTDRGFTGQRELGAAGLQDFNARWFDVALGTFSSADSWIPSPYDPPSLNRYGYALNNPLRYTDPTGHRACEGPRGECSYPGLPVQGYASSPVVNTRTATSTSWSQTVQRRNDATEAASTTSRETASTASASSVQDQEGGSLSDLIWGLSDLSQDVAASASATGAVVETTTTAVGCVGGPEACVAGFSISLAMDMLVFNRIESAASWLSTISTAAADYLDENTRFDTESGTLVIGESTATSIAASIAGTIVPVSVVDLPIDLYMVSYNAGARPGITLPRTPVTGPSFATPLFYYLTPLSLQRSTDDVLFYIQIGSP